MSFHSISSLAPGDQLLFNRFGRGPTITLAHQTITDAFETIVSTYPCAAAVRECFDSERALTYTELDWRSNIVANLLIEDYGVGPDHRVVCVFSRCIEMCAFIMGVLKTGAQYVPVDGAVMVESSLTHVIRDSGAVVVLCLSKNSAKVERSMPVEQSVDIVALDALDAIWSTGDTRRPAVSIQPQYGAYVIYTSGTTGIPKGVDCSHENVVNTLTNEPSKLGITTGVNVACILMLGFDMCAWEVPGTLINGGTLCLRGSSRQGGDREIWDACLKRVDVVTSTPSCAQKYFPRRVDFPNIKTIAVGGEPCPVLLAEEWAPHVRFQNICGPTEVTILNSAKIHQPGTQLTIGKPNPNTTVYILDESLNPVRIGGTGLMWVGGRSVSKGYVNLPELTAEKYRADKFTMDGRMMFNTGDLGRWDSHGELEPLGRKDDQVKIKGCRVELDGVSVSVESFPAVEKASALTVGGDLWCFYSGVGMIDEKALQDHLASRLNHYARPSRLIQLPSMPMAPCGKIDRAALKELAAGQTSADEARASKMPQSAAPVESDGKKACEGSDACEKGWVETALSEASDEEEFVETEMALPEKKGVHGGRWMRYKGLDVYRKLFTLILAVNVIVFIVMATHSSGGLPVDHIATAVAANLLVAVAVRQDHVVNLVFWLATRLPTSAPLWIRRHLARCYHMGGVHSGAAVTATLWWVVFAVQSTAYYVGDSKRYHIDGATVGLTLAILALLLLILGMSWPAVRIKLHDQFEWTHRFAGWLALALVWAHLVVSAASLKRPAEPLGAAVARAPALWLLAPATVAVAAPWLRLRRVAVVAAEPLSPHAVRLHFAFATPPPGAAVRLSDRPLREWHAFAAIAPPPPPPGAACAAGVRGFSVVISRAGDWTARLIARPPRGRRAALWTRGAPAAGVLRVAPLFRRVVLVATGSGIGPCLPVLLAGAVPCRVLWAAPAHAATFGAAIVATVRRADPRAVLWDTRACGRPDLALEAFRLYKRSGAEAVCVVSNGPVTAKLVYDLETRGIPAFGPIVDS